MSYSRFYHYVVTAECLGLVEKDEGKRGYRLSKEGRAVSRRNVSDSRPLSEVEAEILRQRLTTCRPVKETASVFIEASDLRTIDDLENHGRVLAITTDRRDQFTLSDLSGKVQFTVSSTGLVNSIRWGAIPILLDLEVIAELIVRPDSPGRKEQHLLFPVNRHLGLIRFKEILDGLIHEFMKDSEWVPIERVCYSLATRNRVGPRQFQRMFQTVWSNNRQEYELSRTMEIAEYPRLRVWVPVMKVDGSIRSHIRLVRNVTGITKIEDEIKKALNIGLEIPEKVEERYSQLGLQNNPFPFASISTSSEVSRLPPISEKEVKPIINFLRTKKPAILKVVGDYGTGKTHLLLWLRETTSLLGDGRIGAYYVANPGVTPRDLVANLTRTIGDKDLIHRVRQLVIEGYKKAFSEGGLKTVRSLFTTASSTLDEGKLFEKAKELASDDLCLNDAEWTRKTIAFVHSREEFIEFAAKQLANLGIPRGVASELSTFAFSDFDSGLKSWAVLTLSRGGERFTYEDHYKALVTILINTGFAKVFFLVDELEDVVASGRVTRRQSSEYLAALRILLDLTINEVGIALAGNPEAWSRLEELYPALSTRLTYSVHLTKLTQQDAEELVRNFLRLSRSRKEAVVDLEPFTTESIKALLGLCDGNRRVFVSLCNEALEYAVSKQLKEITGKTIGGLIQSRAQKKV